MDLRPTARDYGTALAKGIVGAAPVVGPLVAEVVGALVPNQRIDRITEVLALLDEKVKGIDLARLNQQFNDEQFVDLLEDGFLAAARAVSGERRHYLAALIGNSLTATTIEYSQGKVLLRLLSELSDPEVVLLQFYAKQTSEDREAYLEKHKLVIQGPDAHTGSSRGELDRKALHSTYRVHLERLGLVRPNFRSPRRGELPEFDDKTGMIKVSYHSITWLGRLLLRFTDLDDGMEEESGRARSEADPG